MLPRFIALLGCLLTVLAGNLAEATTIVVLEKGGSIYLGADSKSVDAVRGASEACKLRRYGDVFVAKAGYADSDRDGPKFTEAFLAVSKGWRGTVEEKADILARAAAREYEGWQNRLLDVRTTIERGLRQFERDASPEERRRAQPIKAKLETRMAEILSRLDKMDPTTLAVAGVDGAGPRAAIRDVIAKRDGLRASTITRRRPFQGLEVLAYNAARRRMTKLQLTGILSLPPAKTRWSRRARVDVGHRPLRSSVGRCGARCHTPDSIMEAAPGALIHRLTSDRARMANAAPFLGPLMPR